MPPAKPPDLEADARRLAVSWEKNKYFILLVLTLLYAAGAILHARRKPFWYDEVFTVLAASAPDAAGVWKAAQTLDAAPPLTHLLTHFAMIWSGRGEIAARLPAIAGFWLFCLCMFWFVRRRLGIFYGFVALLLPLVTQAYEYAYEARPYGLELGFCGLMLVSWQAATDSRPQRRFKHIAACAAVALSLIGALMCQYYAVLLWLPLAGGEAYRWWKTRRLDWGVWAAMVFGATPVIWRFATLRAVVAGFSQNPWAETYPIQALEFWNDMLQPGLFLLVLGLAATTLWVLKSPNLPGSSDKPLIFPPWELVAALLFLTIPVFAVGFGVLVTHVYSPRYALTAITGVILLLPAVVARLAGGRSLVAFLMLALAALPLLAVTTIPPPRDLLSEEFVLLDALKQGPVVVADGQLFVQMWFYLPEPLKSNMIFLVDKEGALKYQTFNTAVIDASLTGVRQSLPMRVIDYRDFATAGREFRLLQNPLKPGWLLEKIAADGGSEVIDRYTSLRQLYRVRTK